MRKSILLLLVILSFLTACSFGELSKEAKELHTQSAQTLFEATRAALRVDLTMDQADKLMQNGSAAFLQRLDEQPDGPCTSCFDAFKKATGYVDQKYWSKMGNTYTFKSGDFTATMIYDPQTGEIQ